MSVVRWRLSKTDEERVEFLGSLVKTTIERVVLWRHGKKMLWLVKWSPKLVGEASISIHILGLFMRKRKWLDMQPIEVRLLWSLPGVQSWPILGFVFRNQTKVLPSDGRSWTKPMIWLWMFSSSPIEFMPSRSRSMEMSRGEESSLWVRVMGS